MDCGWDSSPLWGLDPPLRIAVGVILLVLGIGSMIACAIPLSAPPVHLSAIDPSATPKSPRANGIGMVIGVIILWFGAKAIFGNKDHI